MIESIKYNTLILYKIVCFLYNTFKYKIIIIYTIKFFKHLKY